MSVGIGTEALQYLFWEYMFRIFDIVSLQCTPRGIYGIGVGKWIHLNVSFIL
jgi:hypothetical protein